MFCQHKNSFLQLECNFNPRILNRMVDLAMKKPHFDQHDGIPPIQRMTSMLPSLYAPQVDATRAQQGFGRLGLCKLIKELHHKDSLIQFQAVHTIMDEVRNSETAVYLIKCHIVFRLVDLMKHENDEIREKICMTLTTLATYLQARQMMTKNQKLMANLYDIIKDDPINEIRFHAANCLKVIADNDFGAHAIATKQSIFIELLLEMIPEEPKEIAIVHLKTLESLFQWDQIIALKCEVLQLLFYLIENQDTDVKACALGCLSQILYHSSGKILSDRHDLIFTLCDLLYEENWDVVINATRCLMFAIHTDQAKWRARECGGLLERLVELAQIFNCPQLQLYSMTALISMVDNPVIRAFARGNLLQIIQDLQIKHHEEWDGTTEITTYTEELLDHGPWLREEPNMAIENHSGVGQDYNQTLNVYTYLGNLRAVKERLIAAIKWNSYDLQ